MVRFVIQKLLHKKWMNFCLIIGFFLFICIAACNPMYQKSALEKMLQNEFAENRAEKNAYPGVISADFFHSKTNSTELKSPVFKDNQKVSEELEKLFPVKALYVLHNRTFSSSNFTSNYSISGESDNRKIKCASMTDLEEHAEIISGAMYSESAKDGVIEVIVSKQGMEKMNIVIGEEIELNTFAYQDAKPIRLKVVGVYGAKDEADPYWVESPNNYDSEVFMSVKAMDEMLVNIASGDVMMYETYYRILDVSNIRFADIPKLRKSVNALKKENGTDSSVTCKVNMTPVLEVYNQNEKKVTATMTILQVPVFILLLAFIYMVSKQMLEMEQGEIAMLKSRGASRMQIILSYLGQSAIIAAIGLVLGIPGGYLLCKILGSADAFLEFVQREHMYVTIEKNALLYGIGAAVIAMGCMTLPVIKHAKVGIVEQKQRTGNNEPPIWKKFFLDILLFVASVYALYNFSHQKDVIMKQVLNGKSLDPLLYLSSSLFMLGAGFMAIRLVPLCIKLVYKIGQKHWKVAIYSSFLQIIRTSNRQIFIAIFLILTVATGIFNANAARSINQNQEERIHYDNGSDIVLEESWKDNVADIRHEISQTLDQDEKEKIKDTMPVVYEEPELQKYDTLQNVKSMTKVIRETNGQIVSKEDKGFVEMIGIQTKEFGETAWMKDGVLDKHWYHYLNQLAKTKNGALVSTNYKTDFKAKVGDTLTIQRYNEVGASRGLMKVTICGFVDAFPSYVKENKKYFFAVNYSDMIDNYGVTPYEVWIHEKDASVNEIYDFIKNEHLKPVKFADTYNQIIQLKNDPMFQVTNGLLTLSFIVILVLCMVGFLIYWILSIRQRALLFGIYRAMGMSMKEVYKMLINEHIFSSIVSIVVGVLVGVVSSKYFIPLIMLAYMPETNTLPVAVVTRASDMIRLGVFIGFMLVTCLVIIGMLLRKMKISQVLKLGEE